MFEYYFEQNVTVFRMKHFMPFRRNTSVTFFLSTFKMFLTMHILQEHQKSKKQQTFFKKCILKYIVRCMIYSIQARFAVFQKQTYFSIHLRCRQVVEINKPRIRFTFDAVVVFSL